MKTGYCAVKLKHSGIIKWNLIGLTGRVSLSLGMRPRNGLKRRYKILLKKKKNGVGYTQILLRVARSMRPNCSYVKKSDSLTKESQYNLVVCSRIL